jgi:hypothetical protein
MRFQKYTREAKDADGELLTWPGGPDGFPFRGPPPPQTKGEEYDNLQLSGKFRCRLFRFNVEQDLKDYIIVRDKCANGLFIMIDRDRVWDEEDKNYRIFLEWVEVAYETAPREGGVDAIKDYARDKQATLLPYNRLAGLQKSGTNW